MNEGNDAVSQVKTIPDNHAIRLHLWNPWYYYLYSSKKATLYWKQVQDRQQKFLSAFDEHLILDGNNFYKEGIKWNIKEHSLLLW